MIRLIMIALSICTVMVSCNSMEKKDMKSLPAIALIITSPPSDASVQAHNTPAEMEKRNVKNLPAIALIVAASPKERSIHINDTTVRNEDNIIINSEEGAAVQEDVIIADLQSDMIQESESIPELRSEVIQKTERVLKTEEEKVVLPDETEENIKFGLKKSS